MTDYMREALACYNGGAYRGCVVLSFIALFEDLRQKLAQLAKVNSTAKLIWKDVEQRAEDQQVFETYMVDQLKSEKLISDADAWRLEQIRNLRNKAAHPSGIHASPEEARYAYFETIDKFLSQPVLKTTHAVDELLTRLANENFFPTSAMSDVADIVSAEMVAIHAAATPYLIESLSKAMGGSESPVPENATRFLVGLARTGGDEILQNLKTRVVKARAEDKSSVRQVVRIIAANPKLLIGSENTTLLRLNALFIAHVDDFSARATEKRTTHPPVLLANMIAAVGTDFVQQHFSSFLDKVLSRYYYSMPLINAFVNVPALREKLVQTWKEAAAAWDFDISNSFSEHVPEFDEIVPRVLTSKEALEIVSGIARAASNNAFKAIDIRNSGFSSVPNLKRLCSAPS